MNRLLGLWALSGLALTGCGTLHSSRNAPGNIEVTQAPTAIHERKVAPPQDPGEHVIIWNAGAFGGVGVVTGTDAVRAMSAGGETSVHFGSPGTTHPHDISLFPLSFPTTGTTVGLNLGLSIGNDNRPANRAGYVEFELSQDLDYALAAGWAWDPGRQTSGPQITASLGPLYARSTTMLDRATSLELGLVIKLPVLSFAWSK